jgi:6-O-methylguanine DNA methyltransferase, DNA binding domain
MDHLLRAAFVSIVHDRGSNAQHRILCNDGSLSGYRWGVARKRALLERETAK